MTDTLGARATDIQTLLTSTIFKGPNAINAVAIWNGLAMSLPQLMILGELLNFLATDTESGQQAILDVVNQRTAASSRPIRCTAAQKNTTAYDAWRKGT